MRWRNTASTSTTSHTRSTVLIPTIQLYPSLVRNSLQFLLTTFESIELSFIHQNQSQKHVIFTVISNILSIKSYWIIANIYSYICNAMGLASLQTHRFKNVTIRCKEDRETFRSNIIQQCWSNLMVTDAVLRSVPFFFMATALLVMGEVTCFLGHFAPKRRYCTFLSGVTFILSGTSWFFYSILPIISMNQ